MQRKVSGNDILFIGVLAAVLAAVLFFYYFFGGESGAEVEITIDGAVYGTYSLDEEQEIPIVIDETTVNLLLISDGKADMTWADCPDKLCVHQKAVSKKNESIVCLPNRVVVRVTDGAESEFDSFAK